MYTMGQFTVSRCTETPLRQYITPLYETKLAIVQQTTDQKQRILSNSDTKHLISTHTLYSFKNVRVPLTNSRWRQFFNMAAMP